MLLRSSDYNRKTYTYLYAFQEKLRKVLREGEYFDKIVVAVEGLSPEESDFKDVFLKINGGWHEWNSILSE